MLLSPSVPLICTLYDMLRFVINTAMNTNEGLLTHYQHIPGVDYVFGTLDRKPSAEECLALHEQYFLSHHKPSVPHGEVLFVNLRPALIVASLVTVTGKGKPESIGMYRNDTGMIEAALRVFSRKFTYENRFSECGSAYGSRTRAPALRGLCPNH